MLLAASSLFVSPATAHPTEMPPYPDGPCPDEPDTPRMTGDPQWRSPTPFNNLNQPPVPAWPGVFPTYPWNSLPPPPAPPIVGGSWPGGTIIGPAAVIGALQGQVAMPWVPNSIGPWPITVTNPVVNVGGLGLVTVNAGPYSVPSANTFPALQPASVNVLGTNVVSVNPTESQCPAMFQDLYPMAPYDVFGSVSGSIVTITTNVPPPLPLPLPVPLPTLTTTTNLPCTHTGQLTFILGAAGTQGCGYCGPYFPVDPLFNQPTAGIGSLCPFLTVQGNYQWAAQVADDIGLPFVTHGLLEGTTLGTPWNVVAGMATKTGDRLVFFWDTDIPIKPRILWAASADGSQPATLDRELYPVADRVDTAGMAFVDVPRSVVNQTIFFQVVDDLRTIPPSPTRTFAASNAWNTWMDDDEAYTINLVVQMDESDRKCNVLDPEQSEVKHPNTAPVHSFNPVWTVGQRQYGGVITPTFGGPVPGLNVIVNAPTVVQVQPDFATTVDPIFLTGGAPPLFQVTSPGQNGWSALALGGGLVNLPALPVFGPWTVPLSTLPFFGTLPASVPNPTAYPGGALWTSPAGSLLPPFQYGPGNLGPFPLNGFSLPPNGIVTSYDHPVPPIGWTVETGAAKDKFSDWERRGCEMQGELTLYDLADSIALAAERIWDMSDERIRLGRIIVTDENLNYPPVPDSVTLLVDASNPDDLQWMVPDVPDVPEPDVPLPSIPNPLPSPLDNPANFGGPIDVTGPNGELNEDVQAAEEEAERQYNYRQCAGSGDGIHTEQYGPYETEIRPSQQLPGQTPAVQPIANPLPVGPPTIGPGVPSQPINLGRTLPGLPPPVQPPLPGGPGLPAPVGNGNAIGTPVGHIDTNQLGGPGANYRPYVYTDNPPILEEWDYDTTTSYNLPDVVVQASPVVPYHDYYRLGIEERCASAYVARLPWEGQPMMPWVDEDVQMGIRIAHALGHYAFNFTDHPGPTLLDEDQHQMLLDPLERGETGPGIGPVEFGSGKSCVRGTVEDPDLPTALLPTHEDYGFMSGLRWNYTGNEGYGRWEGTELERSRLNATGVPVHPCGLADDEDSCTLLAEKWPLAACAAAPGHDEGGLPALPFGERAFERKRGNQNGCNLDILILDHEPGFSHVEHYRQHHTGLDPMVDPLCNPTTPPQKVTPQPPSIQLDCGPSNAPLVRIDDPFHGEIIRTKDARAIRGFADLNMLVAPVMVDAIAIDTGWPYVVPDWDPLVLDLPKGGTVAAELIGRAACGGNFWARDSSIAGVTPVACKWRFVSGPVPVYPYFKTASTNCNANLPMGPGNPAPAINVGGRMDVTFDTPGTYVFEMEVFDLSLLGNGQTGKDTVTIQVNEVENIRCDGMEFPSPTAGAPPLPNGGTFILADDPDDDWKRTGLKHPHIDHAGGTNEITCLTGRVEDTNQDGRHDELEIQIHVADCTLPPNPFEPLQHYWLSFESSTGEHEDLTHYIAIQWDPTHPALRNATSEGNEYKPTDCRLGHELHGQYYVDNPPSAGTLTDTLPGHQGALQGATCNTPVPPGTPGPVATLINQAPCAFPTQPFLCNQVATSPAAPLVPTCPTTLDTLTPVPIPCPPAPLRCDVPVDEDASLQDARDWAFDNVTEPQEVAKPWPPLHACWMATQPALERAPGLATNPRLSGGELGRGDAWPDPNCDLSRDLRVYWSHNHTLDVEIPFAEIGDPLPGDTVSNIRAHAWHVSRSDDAPATPSQGGSADESQTLGNDDDDFGPDCGNARIRFAANVDNDFDGVDDGMLVMPTLGLDGPAFDCLTSVRALCPDGYQGATDARADAQAFSHELWYVCGDDGEFGLRLIVGAELDAAGDDAAQAGSPVGFLLHFEGDAHPDSLHYLLACRGLGEHRFWDNMAKRWLPPEWLFFDDPANQVRIEFPDAHPDRPAQLVGFGDHRVWVETAPMGACDVPGEEEPMPSSRVPEFEEPAPIPMGSYPYNCDPGAVPQTTNTPCLGWQLPPAQMIGQIVPGSWPPPPPVYPFPSLPQATPGFLLPQELGWNPPPDVQREVFDEKRAHQWDRVPDVGYLQITGYPNDDSPIVVNGPGPGAGGSGGPGGSTPLPPSPLGFLGAVDGVYNGLAGLLGGSLGGPDGPAAAPSGSGPGAGAQGGMAGRAGQAAGGQAAAPPASGGGAGAGTASGQATYGYGAPPPGAPAAAAGPGSVVADDQDGVHFHVGLYLDGQCLTQLACVGATIDDLPTEIDPLVDDDSFWEMKDALKFTQADNGVHTIRAELWKYSAFGLRTALLAEHEIQITVAITPDAPDEGDDGGDGDGGDGDSSHCQFSTDRSPDEDFDGDGVSDYCDDDSDGDGIPDPLDLCTYYTGEDPLDSDADGRANVCDDDDDNDGVPDDADNCPMAYNPGQENNDGDGLGDTCDQDRDGDRVTNWFDALPDNKDETLDSDRDGIGDNADPDDDNDGIPDDEEALLGLDPGNAASRSGAQRERSTTHLDDLRHPDAWKLSWQAWTAIGLAVAALAAFVVMLARRKA